VGANETGSGMVWVLRKLESDVPAR